jgi:hypothetical protein
MYMPVKSLNGLGNSLRVQQLVPAEDSIQLQGLLMKLSHPSTRLRPFSDGILDFCARFSSALFRDGEARSHPEIQALAFWMRKAELMRLKEEFSSLQRDCTLLAPRGLVFHVPPSNVDTMFIYSWMFSVLTGNSNIIRLSDRASDVSSITCRVLNRILEGADPAITGNTVIIRYGHGRDITEAISAIADVRVIWGGDETVSTIRSIPVSPHARDLTFPDRHSLAIVDAESYLVLDSKQCEALAGKFYNDTFWFDQMACSSPRLLIWTGIEQDCEAAGVRFFQHLERELESREYLVPMGARLNKLTFAYRAILDEPVDGFHWAGHECLILDLQSLLSPKTEHCGGGVLFQAQARRLEDVASFVSRRDQTITHFGYSQKELTVFARLLNGRGIDRFVPIGQGLRFNRFWDGYDLLQEFTRAIYVES